MNGAISLLIKPKVYIGRVLQTIDQDTNTEIKSKQHESLSLVIRNNTIFYKSYTENRLFASVSTEEHAICTIPESKEDRLKVIKKLGECMRCLDTRSRPYVHLEGEVVYIENLELKNLQE